MLKLALDELGVLDEAVGEPPEIDVSVRMLFDAYWEMRAFAPLDEALSMPSVLAWLEAHEMRDALSEWLPYLTAMESERREWLSAEMAQRAQQR
jgi:hypothetical protein